MCPSTEVGQEKAPLTHDSSSNSKHDNWKTLCLIRLLYCTYYMATGVIQPFLPVYYASLGFKGQIIGLLGSITPFTTFMVGPLWGVVSDKLQSPFAILYTTIFVALLGQLAVSLFDNPYYVMIQVCIQSIFGAPVKSLIDSLVLQQLSDRSEYGKMRLWSLLGTGVGCFFAGSILKENPVEQATLIQDSSSSLWAVLLRILENLTGYRLLFVAHILLHIPVFVTLRYFQLDRRAFSVQKGVSSVSKASSQSISLREAAKTVLSNSDAIVHFIAVFVMGIAGGVADNFTYVRFREIGASSLSMGFSRLCSSVCGAIMFWYSGALSKRMGSEMVMVLSLLTVASRFGLFVIMDHPVYGYFAEGLRGSTFGCFWSTSTLYASQLAPDGARSTMLLFLNGLYNGLGRSAGAVVGGRLQSSLGTAHTFMLGSIMYVVCAILFMLYHSGFRKVFRKRDETKKLQ